MMQNSKLAIIGASGHGKVAADIAQISGKYQQIFFLDDNTELNECMGFSVRGSSNDIELYIKDADFFVAIGNAVIRKRIIERLLQEKACIATLIHPQAVIGSKVEIGIGSIIMAGVVLNADCKLGCGSIVNTGASVDHDCVLGDYVHVSVGAHLAGSVTVGENTWIGAGAIVNNNVTITSSCMIGSGAVVVRNIEIQGTYVGVPARELHHDRKNENKEGTDL